MKLTKRLFAILLAAAMVFTILPVVALADDPVGTSAISASDFIAYEADGGVAISDYTGTVNSVNFTGIEAVQLAYQPRFYFTAAGVSSIQAYAEANDYDTLVIHATGANFNNNGGVINNQLWFGASEWSQTSVDVDTLTSSFYFWFSSEQTGTMYLWFEFATAPIVTTASFANPWWSDQGNCTFSIGSAEYQPHFYFSQAGIDRMQAYAAKWGVDTLRIYGEFTGSNSLVLNNAAWIGQGETGRYLDVPIADMSTSFDIWSQSDNGYTAITLRFEAFRAPIVTTASFSNPWWQDLGNCTYSIASADYQPRFYFSDAGISRMQAYAAKWGVDTLRITGQYTGANSLYLNGTGICTQGSTGYLDVPIADMTTAFDIWSQDDSGYTVITLQFEAYKMPVINAGSFSGPGSFTNNLDGTVGLASAEYQPHFYFTLQAVSDIQSYAATNGYDVLRITATYAGTNSLVLNNAQWIGNGGTNYLDVSIADLSTSFDIWSQSEGTTNVTFAFEFLHPSHTWVESETIASTCTVAGHIDYECFVCGETMTEALPLAAHSYTIPVDTVLPTCTSQGYTIYACSGCGARQSTDFVAALNHNYVYTDNNDGTSHTVTCTRCDLTSIENHTYENGTCVYCGASAATLKIKSASVRLDEDIDIIYAVCIPAGYTNPYMVVNGTTITDFDRSGSYCLFTYTGITPQRMSDNISATLYATNDGVTETDAIASYSIKQYCSDLLTANPNDTALKTLLSDLLTYGAAAQAYCGYNTGSPATADLDLTPSRFSAISGKSVSFTGTADADTDWVAATLVLGNTVATRFYFVTDDISKVNVDIAVGNNSQTFDEFVSVGNGKYYFDFFGIEATQFDDTVSAAFSIDGVPTGRTINYSVNAYICGTQNAENSTLRALVRALYNYGATAAGYPAG